MGGLSDIAKVGAIVIIVVVLLAGAVQLIKGNILQAGRTYFVLVQFENALGIKKGMGVKLAGLDQGWVEKAYTVEGPNKSLTEVKMRMKNAAKLHENAVFTISQEGLFGEKYVNLDGGSKDKPVVGEGYIFQGKTQGDISEVISQASSLIASVEQLISPEMLGGAIKDITVSLTESLDKVNIIIEQAGGLIEGNQGYLTASLKNVQLMSEHFLEMSKNLETASVEATKLASDPQYRDTLDRILANLDSATANLSTMTGEVNKLVGDPSVQQDAKDTVRLLKENLEQTKSTIERFSKTLDGVDGLVEGAGGLMDDAGGAISEAKSALQKVQDVGDAVDVKMSLTVRAVDQNKDEHLGNEDLYVGDLNAAVGYGDAYVKFGSENIGEENDANLLFGYGGLDGFSMMGGVYRSELGLGAAYWLPDGGGAEALWYDTEDPKINAYGYIPVADSVNVVLGVEDVENEALPSVGINIELK